MALTNPSIDRYGSNSDARNILVLVGAAAVTRAYSASRALKSRFVGSSCVWGAWPCDQLSANTCALPHSFFPSQVHSRNLLDWRIGTTVLVPNDGLPWEQSLWHTGYHYADIVIDGADLLAAIRTAYDGAHSYHDSNQITFKRVANFRQYLGP